MSEQRLTAVETKVTGIEKAFDRHTAAVEELARGVHAMAVRMESIPDHEARIRELEVAAQTARGKVAGISAAVGLAVAAVPHLLKFIGQ